VLILHGDRDAHVPVEHAYLLANEMQKGGNRDVTVKIFADHNHLFLKDKDGRFTNKRYLKLLEHTNRLSAETYLIRAKLPCHIGPFCAVPFRIFPLPHALVFT
jgi:dienelactone hydrolase